MSGPTVVIHGGAGSALDSGDREERIRAALNGIIEQLWQDACDGATAMELVESGCIALEDCEHFNAGRGSKLQRDGSIRMSAAVMEGMRRVFSGVINVERVQNPIQMALRLQDEDSRVLDGGGARMLARQMQLPVVDPIVGRRFDRWLDRTRNRRLNDGESKPEEGGGTIGVVARDGDGRLAAGTSTGGRGFERVGRVSDTATVAGNYATDRAAVSCTGNGEDIVDEALAARIAVRIEDGQPLEEVVRQTITACDDRGGRLAAIAVDADGRMGWDQTTEVLLAVGRNERTGIDWAF